MVGAGLAGEPHASHQLARTAGILAGNDFPIRVVAIFRNGFHVLGQAVNELVVADVVDSISRLWLRPGLGRHRRGDAGRQGLAA